MKNYKLTKISFDFERIKEVTLEFKQLFQYKRKVAALIINAKSCSIALKELKGSLLSFPKFQSIIKVPEFLVEKEKVANPDSKRLLLLNISRDFDGNGNEKINEKSINGSSVDTISGKEHGGSENLTTWYSLEAPQVVKEFIKLHDAIVTDFCVELNYDYWSLEEILSCILPQGMDVPTGFATAGHIAHFNLKPEHEPYKKLIGQIVLDKNSVIKTVVNKTDTIDNTFRFFSMEVLAGITDTVTKVREGHYWNSRLQAEHLRLLSFFKPNEAICDVFAGVGPFALPAAKLQNCVVFANDLNPSSYHYLAQNITANKLGHRVAPFNMCGREFIKNSLEILDTQKYWTAFDEYLHFASRRNDKDPQKPATRVTRVAKQYDHYVMNLPASATDFLDAFTGLYHGREPRPTKLPMIHCYSFSSSPDLEKDTLLKTSKALGVALQEKDVVIYKVRDVSPKKMMMCISFRLPQEAAFSGKRKAPLEKEA